MWFKKKSVLLAEGNYNTEKSADGTTDLRTTEKNYNNTNSRIKNAGLPSAADANKYFYLPALGNYNSGRLFNVGFIGYYWSSSGQSRDRYGAYILYFGSDYVFVGNGSRYAGFRAEAFQ